MQALIDLGSKINTTYLDFAEKVGLQVWLTNIGAQKIKDSKLDTLNMVIAFFLIEDKDGKAWFFEKTFWLANLSMCIALGIFFFTLNNVEINFVNWNLSWRLYTAAEALPTMRWVELIGKKVFAAIVFDLKDKTFVVYVAFIG